MNKTIKVKEVIFNTETSTPELTLEDGTSRVVELIPTGNCWVTYWVTPGEKEASRLAYEAADKKWREQTITKPKAKKKIGWGVNRGWFR